MFGFASGVVSSGVFSGVTFGLVFSDESVFGVSVSDASGAESVLEVSSKFAVLQSCVPLNGFAVPITQ